MKHILEVGARTVDDVLAAEKGGADQAELYSSPLEGALSPSAGLIKSAVEAAGPLKLMVMIRPRAGDFLYSANEFKTMQRDVEIAVEAGADGIMCGILTADGRLDRKRMEDMVRRVGDRQVTLHRAFDFARDPLCTLEEAIDCGCDRILTIGQQQEATFDRKTLLRILARASERIKIMLGLGADFDTRTELEAIVRETGANEYHIVNGYRTRASRMEWNGGQTIHRDDYLKKDMFSLSCLSEEAVREARNLLDKLDE